MSENETEQTQATAENPEAQLSDAELEQAAGGTSIVDTIIDGVNSAIENVSRLFT